MATVDGVRVAAARVAMFYGVYFFSNGVLQPFFPVWLADRGMSDARIALIVAAPMLLRVATAQLFGRFADQVPDRRVVVKALATIALALGLCLTLAQQFWTILLLAAGMTMFWQAMPPIVDALALNLVRRHGVDYGRMRVWGSIGFVAANTTGGVVLSHGGSNAVLGLYLIVLASLIGIAFLLPREAARTGTPVEADPNLLRRGGFLLVLAAAALVQASHGAFNSFGSIQLHKLGYSGSTIGVLWGLASGAEIAMFWAGARLVARFGAVGLIGLAAAVAILRWPIFAMAPGIVVLVLLQLTHAVTFGASYLGLMRFIGATVDEGRAAAAQSTYVTIAGTITALVTVMTGPLYRNFGGLAFAVMALLPAATLLLLWLGRGAIRGVMADTSR